MFKTKKLLKQKINALSKRLDNLEAKEKAWLEVAATFGTQLNLIQAKQIEINQKYEKLIKKSEDVLNYCDTLRKMAGKVHKENGAFVDWCKSLATRLQKIEEKIE